MLYGMRTLHFGTLLLLFQMNVIMSLLWIGYIKLGLFVVDFFGYYVIVITVYIMFIVTILVNRQTYVSIALYYFEWNLYGYMLRLRYAFAKGKGIGSSVIA